MRKPRELLNHARYHVVARANRKEMILDSPKIKALFLDVVGKAKRRYSFSIENFCIMGNHFHIIIKPGVGVSLFRIMQWILSVFASAYNRLHNLTGHVWGERFFSKAIKNLREYVAIFNYIDENPVRAGLVASRSDWVFGGAFFRKSGKKAIMDPLPPYIALLLLLNERHCSRLGD